jgi:leucine-rich repeat-containing protein 49
MSSITDQLNSISLAPRYDLIPVYDDLPTDGVVFARARNQPDSMVVFRTPDERLRNPERLNLDRRQLEHCPILEQEQRLRLLNYQNNMIKQISNLENLPNLIFLDLYNNQITSLDGPLSSVKGLRVLMAGKNKIQKICNLQALKKLDVLDLHSNEIKVIEGLEGLSDLRVLNLAGMLTVC